MILNAILEYRFGRFSDCVIPVVFPSNCVCGCRVDGSVMMHTIFTGCTNGTLNPAASLSSNWSHPGQDTLGSVLSHVCDPQVKSVAVESL